MSCLTDERIHQWVDHELDPAAQRAAAEHLRECPDCTRAVEQLEALAAGVEKLPQSVAPPRDLWPDIEERLAPPTPLRRLAPWWMQAAAAVAVLAAGVWIGSIREPESPAPQPVADTDYQQLADEVSLLRNQVEALVAERGGSFDPATVTAVNDTLQTLTQADAEIAEAIERDPGNRRLYAMRASSVKREAHVLADLMVALNGASMVGLESNVGESS